MKCYCYTCKREFKSSGIAQHRAMHRDKKQDCEISYSDGRTVKYNFSEKRAKEHREKADREQ